MHVKDVSLDDGGGGEVVFGGVEKAEEGEGEVEDEGVVFFAVGGGENEVRENIFGVDCFFGCVVLLAYILKICPVSGLHGDENGFGDTYSVCEDCLQGT